MRKIFRAILLLLVPYFLCGCSSFLSWEGWSAASTKVLVINNTEDIKLDVSVNGRQTKEGQMMEPGDHRSVLLPNFHEGTNREYVILVKGHDCCGKFIGVIEKKYDVAAYKQGCEPFVINSYNFRGRK